MDNVYKRARLEAAKRNESLSSVGRAYSRLYMSRERLLMIEQTDPSKRQADPNPEEVVMMAKVYEAPELYDHYCTHQCPIGKATRTPLRYDSLGEIAAGLMAALHFLEQANDQIHRILSDSCVSEEEQEEFRRTLCVLKDISYNTSSLELWAQVNGYLPQE